MGDFCQENKRIAIIIDKSLTKGQAANVAAILMGQVSVSSDFIYDNRPLIDQSGVFHCAIKNNIIVLKAGPYNLKNLWKETKATISFIFTEEGTMFSDDFDAYRKFILSNKIDTLRAVG